MSGPSHSLTGTFSSNANPNMDGRMELMGYQPNGEQMQAVIREYSVRNGHVTSEENLYTTDQLKDKKGVEELLNQNDQTRYHNLGVIEGARLHIENHDMEGVIARVVPETRGPTSILPPGFSPNTP